MADKTWKIIACLILLSAFGWGQTYTTNLSLTKPAHGATNWDTALNGNFDTLDALFPSAKLDPTKFVYPGAGICVSTGTSASAWGTSKAAPSGTIVGTSDSQALTNKDLTGSGNTFPTFNQNTTGTASNLSGTPALPNGTTGTTQSASDNSTKVATTAYVDSGLSGKAASNAATTVNGQSCALGGSCTISAGAMVLLEQHTASNSTSLNFTTCISSTYDDYIIDMLNLVPATNSVDMWMRVSTDGGATFDSANNYYYAWSYVGNTGSSGNVNASPAGAILLFNSISSTSSFGGFSGRISLYAPGSSINRKSFNFQTVGNESTALFNGTGIGLWNSNSAINAFQFLFSSGNIASGTVRCYGIAKS